VLDEQYTELLDRANFHPYSSIIMNITEIVLGAVFFQS